MQLIGRLWRLIVAIIVMSHIQTSRPTDFPKVNTVHILKTGEIIISLEDYLRVQSRFAWVNQAYIISTIFRLRRLTETHKKSVIVVYEEGQIVKEHINVEESFKPLVFC